MDFKKRIVSTLLVGVLLGLAVLGTLFEMKMPVVKQTLFSTSKETIYFGYSDEALTGFVSSAAVSFGERYDARVIPILINMDDILGDVNRATMDEDKNSEIDVYIINNDSLEKAYLAGLADQVTDPEEVLNTRHFPRTALNAVAYKDHYVAYPFYFETSTLLYNKTYLNMCLEQLAQKALAAEEETEEDEEEIEMIDLGDDDNSEGEIENGDQKITSEGIPLTMDGLLYIADAFDAPEQVEGIFTWNVSDIFYNYWVVGSYLTVGGESGDDHSKIDVLNDSTIGCLEVYKNLNQFFSIEAKKITTESCIQDFIDGKCMFTMASSDQIENLKQARSEGALQFEYGFANMPQISDTLGSRNLSVTNAVAVNGYSKHKKLANAFATYLTDEVAPGLYDKSGKLPACIDEELVSPERLVFFEEYKRSVSLPKMMEIGNFWLQLEAMFSKIWNGEEITPLLEELQNQIQTQISK